MEKILKILIEEREKLRKLLIFGYHDILYGKKCAYDEIIDMIGGLLSIERI